MRVPCARAGQPAHCSLLQGRVGPPGPQGPPGSALAKGDRVSVDQLRFPGEEGRKEPLGPQVSLGALLGLMAPTSVQL